MKADQVYGFLVLFWRRETMLDHGEIFPREAGDSKALAMIRWQIVSSYETPRPRLDL